MTRVHSKKRLLTAAVAALAGAATVPLSAGAVEEGQKQWEIHDMSRPQPKVVEPGTASTEEKAGRPPSDAVVLFDGKDLSKWAGGKGGDARWTVRDGYVEVKRKTGDIRTRESFGSCQLHVEWRAPAAPGGGSQGRGNSGVFLMGIYEVQIFDSYNNRTYPDGQAGSVYGQGPPLVNACRPPEEWQAYDIIFHRPHFDERGKCTSPATMTVLHNGVLIQDHFTLTGPTAHKRQPPYRRHPDKLPLSLQDHGSPVRYRNIWIRPLED